MENFDPAVEEAVQFFRIDESESRSDLAKELEKRTDIDEYDKSFLIKIYETKLPDNIFKQEYGFEKNIDSAIRSAANDLVERYKSIHFSKRILIYYCYFKFSTTIFPQLIESKENVPVVSDLVFFLFFTQLPLENKIEILINNNSELFWEKIREYLKQPETARKKQLQVFDTKLNDINYKEYIIKKYILMYTSAETTQAVKIDDGRPSKVRKPMLLDLVVRFERRRNNPAISLDLIYAQNAKAFSINKTTLRNWFKRNRTHLPDHRKNIHISELSTDDIHHLCNELPYLLLPE